MKPGPMNSSKLPGVPSSIIYWRCRYSLRLQHKSALASDIVGGNPYISDYVNSHPLASKISNDDYGQLRCRLAQSLLKVNPLRDTNRSYGSDIARSYFRPQGRDEGIWWSVG